MKHFYFQISIIAIGFLAYILMNIFGIIELNTSWRERDIALSGVEASLYRLSRAQHKYIDSYSNAQYELLRLQEKRIESYNKMLDRMEEKIK